VSYWALRLGALFFANERFTNGERQHRSALGPTDIEFHENAQHFRKAVFVFFVAMRYAQGCSLELEGAQRAASKMLRRTSCGTGLSAKARGLQRSRISSWTGIGLVQVSA